MATEEVNYDLGVDVVGITPATAPPTAPSAPSEETAKKDVEEKPSTEETAAETDPNALANFPYGSMAGMYMNNPYLYNAMALMGMGMGMPQAAGTTPATETEGTAEDDDEEAKQASRAKRAKVNPMESFAAVSMMAALAQMGQLANVLDPTAAASSNATSSATTNTGSASDTTASSTAPASTDASDTAVPNPFSPFLGTSTQQQQQLAASMAAAATAYQQTNPFGFYSYPPNPMFMMPGGHFSSGMDMPGSKRKRSRSSRYAARQCAKCHVTSTTKWRRSHDKFDAKTGKYKFLCNSCGLKQSRQLKLEREQREKEMKRVELRAAAAAASGISSTTSETTSV